MRNLIFILLIMGSFTFLCHAKDNPTFEEYKKSNPSKDYVDWDWEYGDLMHHADGTLRDQDLTDNYTPQEANWILALFVFAFLIWAGILSRDPTICLVLWIIALIGSMIVYNF